ncbi:unnamed protein product [Caenorhabditis brenneri]
MMSQSFPLLRLPILAVEQVLKNFDIGDLIQISFSSKRIHRFIKSFRFSIINFGLCVSKRGTSILAKLNFSESWRNIAWAFNHILQLEESKNRPVTMLFGRSEVKSFVVAGQLYSYINRNYQKYVKASIEYFTDLFRCPLPGVRLEPDGIPKHRRPFLVGFHECSSLGIYGEIALRNGELRELILENCSVSESIRLDIPIKKSFKSDIRLWKQPKYLNIHRNSHFITREMFLDLKLTNFNFSYCSLTPDDCRSFVERWMDSDDTEVKSFCLHWGYDLPANFNLDGLGLEIKEFNPVTRSHAYRVTHDFAYDVSVGQDFVRKDGVLASVMIFENIFFFCAWHERFHDLDGVEIHEF